MFKARVYSIMIGAPSDHGLSQFYLRDEMGIYLTDRSRHHPYRYTQWTSETDAKHLIEKLDNKCSKYK